MSDSVLLHVDNLTKHYPVKGRRLFEPKGFVHAVDQVSFSLRAGETLGLVGESGSGKSTIGKQIVALEKPTSGHVLYRGQDIHALSKKEFKAVRTELQMIFQDPYSSLNPRKTVFDLLAAPLLYHHLANRQTIERKIEHLLDLVGLPHTSKKRYPHEFSGGQQQRIGIARALSMNPKLVVCDEPVSALDVSIQAQILNLLQQLQQELNLTYLFIGHGLAAVKYVSTRIAVLYLGRIVELAPASEIFRRPRHPYTKALGDAAPIPDPTIRPADDEILRGEIPSNVYLPTGCRFHPRCPYAHSTCADEEPELLPVAGATAADHLVACPVNWSATTSAQQSVPAATV